jgi:hypothetical protein
MKEISFDEALKLPEGVRIRATNQFGQTWEGVTGGYYYNDGTHVGFIENGGQANGFQRHFFPTITVLEESLEIPFDEALKLPKGTRIKGIDSFGTIYEGVVGGDYYNDGIHLGYIRNDGRSDGFSKCYFPTIIVLSNIKESLKEEKSGSCGHKQIKKVPLGIGPSAEEIWVCCDCGEEII